VRSHHKVLWAYSQVTAGGAHCFEELLFTSHLKHRAYIGVRGRRWGVWRGWWQRLALQILRQMVMQSRGRRLISHHANTFVALAEMAGIQLLAQRLTDILSGVAQKDSSPKG
jgi:hypothetical protein